MKPLFKKTNNPTNNFRRWTRSKFGILRSLHAVVKICTLCIAYNIVKCPLTVYAQADTIVIAPLREVDEVEVRGKKSLLLPGSGVMVISVPVSGLRQYPSSGLQDILEYAANIDIRQRGRNGVQSDISIRGGTFDHVLVMLNGISMNDPQTGHGSMDLPVDKDIIERIEVTFGPSSMIHGPGAFTGAVNIITAKDEPSHISAGLEAGSFGLLKTKLNLVHTKGPLSSVLSLSRQSSQGYAPDTDFRTYNIYLNSSYSSARLNATLQAGYQNKHFGASGFYTPLFPHQFERTGLSFMSLQTESGIKMKLSSRLYWRQRHDEFLLDRDDPAFYRNLHRTDVYGARIMASRTAGRFTVHSALDFRSENMLSNSLGLDTHRPVMVRGSDSLWYDKKFSRSIYGWSTRVIYEGNRSEITAGVNFLTGTNTGPQVSVLPSLGFEYTLATNLRIFADLNAGSAMPSFTDLFYKDPNNEGFSGLEAASIISAGTGIKFSNGIITGSAAIFASKGDNIIEWLWSGETHRYKPFNTDNYFTAGFEASSGCRFITKGRLEHSLSASYMYLLVKKPHTGSTAKYNTLKHKLSVMLNTSLPYNFRMSFNISYQDREGSFVTYSESGYINTLYKPVWLADMHIKYQYRNVLLFTGATNILNITYSDAGSLYQPGRWFSCGINLKLQ